MQKKVDKRNQGKFARIITNNRRQTYGNALYEKTRTVLGRLIRKGRK